MIKTMAGIVIAKAIVRVPLLSWEEGCPAVLSVCPASEGMGCPAASMLVGCLEVIGMAAQGWNSRCHSERRGCSEDWVCVCEGVFAVFEMAMGNKRLV